jgi:hypothetical protein
VRASGSRINNHTRKREKPVSLLIHTDRRAASLSTAISSSNVIRRALTVRVKRCQRNAAVSATPTGRTAVTNPTSIANAIKRQFWAMP